MKNSTIKIITYVVILLVAVLAIGFAVFITNGFTEKPKSFYVDINGNKVASSASGYLLEKDKPLKCKVKFLSSDKKNYTVQILSAKSDFAYTVDSKNCGFTGEEDFTDCFVITKTGDDFTIETVGNLYSVLQSKNPDAKVNYDRKAVPDEDLFTLVITSESDKATIKIGFRVPSPETEIVMSPARLVI